MSLFVDPVALWLMATRISGWLLTSPGFTEMNTPRTVRVALVMWLSFLMLPMVGPLSIHIATMPELIAVMVTEFIIGAGYGLTLRLIFSAVQFGGVLVDSELGYLYAQQVNPALPLSGGIFSRLFLMLAVLYFWLFDYFRIVVAALHESFILVPLGTLQRSLFDIGLLIKLSAAIFVGGLTIAAPIMALMFFVTITLGFLARTVQGVNLFSDTFTLKIAVGLGGVIILLPLLFLMMRIQLERIVPMSSQYFRFLSPTP